MAYQFTEEESKDLKAAGLIVMQFDDFRTHNPENPNEIGETPYDTTVVIVTENPVNPEEPYQIDWVIKTAELELYKTRNTERTFDDAIICYVSMWRSKHENKPMKGLYYEYYSKINANRDIA